MQDTFLCCSWLQTDTDESCHGTALVLGWWETLVSVAYGHDICLLEDEPSSNLA